MFCSTFELSKSFLKIEIGSPVEHTASLKNRLLKNSNRDCAKTNNRTAPGFRTYKVHVNYYRFARDMCYIFQNGGDINF